MGIADAGRKSNMFVLCSCLNTVAIAYVVSTDVICHKLLSNMYVLYEVLVT